MALFNLIISTYHKKFINKSISDELLGSKRINHLQEYRTDYLFDHPSHSKSNPKPISVPSNLVFSNNHPDSVNHEVWCHILSHLILFMSTFHMLQHLKYHRQSQSVICIENTVWNCKICAWASIKGFLIDSSTSRLEENCIQHDK